VGNFTSRSRDLGDPACELSRRCSTSADQNPPRQASSSGLPPLLLTSPFHPSYRLPTPPVISFSRFSYPFRVTLHLVLWREPAAKALSVSVSAVRRCGSPTCSVGMSFEHGMRTLSGHELALLLSGRLRVRPWTCTTKNVNVRTRSVWRSIVSSPTSTVIPCASGVRSCSIRGWLGGRLFRHNWSWRTLGGRRISQYDLLRFCRHFAHRWSCRAFSFQGHARRRSSNRNRI
jgi:hypothetical protein